MPNTETSLVTDVLDKVGGAALDAVLGAAGSAIWNALFPPSEPIFNSQQLDQIGTLFKDVLGDQEYRDQLDSFKSTQRDFEAYRSQPSTDQLYPIGRDFGQEMTHIASHGYISAQIYMTVASQYILVSKYKLDTAVEPAKAGAKKNVSGAALSALQDLIDIEKSYGAAYGWAEYIAFKRATVLYEGEMSETAVAAFGAGYSGYVQKLLGIVNDYAPADLQQVIYPPYHLALVPFDPATMLRTWDVNDLSHGMSTGARMASFSCPRSAPGLPDTYYPLGDLATSYFSPAAGPNPTNDPTYSLKNPASHPSHVLYIEAGESPLNTPTGYKKIYDDHGSGNIDDYVGFSTLPNAFGTWVGTQDKADKPINDDRIRVIGDPYFYTQVTLGEHIYDDQHSSADEDCLMYAHPQFGEYGLYILTRSHSRPDPDTVNGLKLDVISGHPKFTPPSK